MANMSVSAMHEFATTAEAVGFEPRDFAALSNNRKIMKQVLHVARGWVAVVAKRFPVWSAFVVGGMEKKAIVERLHGKRANLVRRFSMSEYTRDILFKSECTVMLQSSLVEFAKVQVKDLGLREGAFIGDMLNESFLREVGLAFCLPGDGPSIRLKYKSQPDGECLSMGMLPIDDPHQYMENGVNHVVFSLERADGNLILGVENGALDSPLDPERTFVFRIRKTPQVTS